MICAKSPFANFTGCLFALLGATLAATASVPAFAADEGDDSNLRGHRFCVGIGASTTPEHLGDLFRLTETVNDSGGVDIGLGVPGTHFEAAKADYTFFRPARQEGLVSVYLLRSFYDAYAVKNHTLVTESQAKTVLCLTPEYRQRFFGHGIGYVGVGIGAADRGLAFSGVSGVFTGAVGIDVGHFYVETRSLYFRHEDAAFTSVFGGVRF